MLERDLERKICGHVRELGGRAYKWVSPGETGVPDRILILPGGRVIFCELKRPGRIDGRTARQKKIAAVLEGLGCEVWLVNDFEDFKRRIRRGVQA